MKKIIFCLPNMNLGGTEKALLSMLSAIDHNEYEITVALIQKSGKLLADIPSSCKVIELPIIGTTVDDLMRGGAVNNFKHYLKRGRLLRAATIVVRKLSGNLFAELKGNFRLIEPLKGEYDIAVSYQLHNPFVTKYVIDKITASKKVVFGHNDFITTHYRVERLCAELAAYDKIYTVSQHLQSELLSISDNLADKTEVFYNIVDKTRIVRMSEEFIPPEYSGNDLKILTVGRLTTQKGYELAINAAKAMKNAGIIFKWYAIGGGELQPKLERLIAENDLTAEFILLGAVANPYPYMRHCDIYCQSSLHEGYCTTTNEAKVLCKPIVTTNVSGAQEQFVHMNNAIICDINAQNITDSLIELIKNKQLVAQFVASLSSDIDDAKSNKLKEFLVL